MEIAIVVIIALVIFGPAKLPELGKSAGKGFREFKDSISGDRDEDKSADRVPASQLEQLTRRARG